MSIKIGRGAVAAGAVSVAALLGLAADQAAAASSVTASVQGGTLHVNGTGAADKLVLRLDGISPTTLVVDVGADGTADFAFDRTTFIAIDVQAGGGDDDVRLDRSGGVFSDEAVTIDGGTGADTLIGDVGDDVLIGGAGNDFADGNIGADKVQLGAGDDVDQWDPGDGSDTVDGGGGNDVLAFHGSNASEHFDIAPSGSHVRLTRDVAAIAMDLDGIERLALDTRAGADRVTVGDLSGTAMKRADVDLSGFDGGDDGSPDVVTAAGSDGADAFDLASTPTDVTVSGPGALVHVTGEAVNDSVDADGRGGVDTATYKGTAGDDDIGIARGPDGVATFVAGGPAVTAIAEELHVAGLAGNDTLAGQNGIGSLTHLTLDGGAGNDVVRGGDGADDLEGGTGNDFVDGNIGADDANLGTGDDVFEWGPGDGSDAVDGQAGDDRLDFNGSNASESLQLSANESRVLLFRDVGQVATDFGGIEHLRVRTLGGTDTVFAGNLGGTGLQTAQVDLSQFDDTPDGQRDAIVLNGTSRRDSVAVTRSNAAVLVDGLPVQMTVLGAEAANDALRLNTLGGRDDVTVAPDVSDLIATSVELGAGQ
jgi:Ca2+-binding RTX toxin-like protein